MIHEEFDDTRSHDCESVIIRMVVLSILFLLRKMT
jgi:hypothetical protein